VLEGKLENTIDKRLLYYINYFMTQQSDNIIEGNDALANFYNKYDYSKFWKGKSYESAADKIAVARFMDIIKRDPMQKNNKFIDLGCGPGRMVQLYESRWDTFVLLDSSIDQLNEALTHVTDKTKSKIVLANAQKIPLKDASCDAGLCVRIFHYIANPDVVFKELHRILVPNGYFILEIPNKRNLKNRLRSLFRKNKNTARSPSLITQDTKKEDVVFINHDPKTIASLLKENKFEIIEILSVSNFRSAFIKKLLPISLLLLLEKYTQKPLSYIWFGPSIYYLIKKIS